MRKRRAYISFPETAGNDPALLRQQKALEGLNIRFDIKIYSQSGLPSEANIEIYNLNKQDLEYLTTCAATWAQKQNLFQLYAGYEGETKMLYSGQVMEATPAGYPDVALTMHGISGAKWWGVNMELQSSNLTVMDLIDRAAREMGYAVNIDDDLRRNNPLLNKKLDDYSFTGSPMDLLETAQSMLGGITADPQTVFISTVNDQITVWSPGSTKTTSALYISPSSGMIGIPQPTGAGCDVKILMNTGITVGDVVQVESGRLPVINGYYFVIGIRHHGELRGNNWYTTLTCARVSNYKANQNGQ